MRQFFTVHPDSGKGIKIVQGQSGYHEFDIAPKTRDSLNAAACNNERDLEIAIACSMFGWSIPMASELS